MPFACLETLQLVIAAIPADRTRAMRGRCKLSGAAHPVFDHIGLKLFNGFVQRSARGEGPGIGKSSGCHLDAGIFKALDAERVVRPCHNMLLKSGFRQREHAFQHDVFCAAFLGTRHHMHHSHGRFLC